MTRSKPPRPTADDRRRHLFADLRMSLGQSGLSDCGSSQLLCPMCWQSVDFDALTLEHVIPKALGGRLETLTCSECNRRAGKELDPHVVAHHRFHEAMQAKGEIRAELDILGHRLAANYSRDPQRSATNFQIVAAATNPAAIASTQEACQAGSVNEFSARLYFGFNDRQRRLAMLKIGYLGVFHRFGYQAARQPGMQQIREMINSPEQSSLPDLTGLSGEVSGAPDAIRERQLTIARKRIGDADMLMVIVRLRVETVVHRFVLIPLGALNDHGFAVLAVEATRHSEVPVRWRMLRV